MSGDAAAVSLVKTACVCARVCEGLVSAERFPSFCLVLHLWATSGLVFLWKTGMSDRPLMVFLSFFLSGPLSLLSFSSAKVGIVFFLA